MPLASSALRALKGAAEAVAWPSHLHPSDETSKVGEVVLSHLFTPPWTCDALSEHEPISGRAAGASAAVDI